MVSVPAAGPGDPRIGSNPDHHTAGIFQSSPRDLTTYKLPWRQPTRRIIPDSRLPLRREMSFRNQYVPK